MVEHIPLILYFQNGTVIVPAGRINAGIVDDHAFSYIRTFDFFADCVIQMRGSAAAVRIGIRIFAGIDHAVGIADLTER